MAGLLLCWARTAVVPEGDWIGLTGVAILKIKPFCFAESDPKISLFFPLPSFRETVSLKVSQHHGVTDL